MNAHVGKPLLPGLLGQQRHHALAFQTEEESAAGRLTGDGTLPIMALHGCAPEHHRACLEGGVVVREECLLCGYRVSYEPVGRDRFPHSGRAPAWETAGPGRDGTRCGDGAAVRG